MITPPYVTDTAGLLLLRARGAVLQTPDCLTADPASCSRVGARADRARDVSVWNSRGFWVGSLSAGPAFPRGPFPREASALEAGPLAPEPESFERGTILDTADVLSAEPGRYTEAKRLLRPARSGAAITLDIFACLHTVCGQSAETVMRQAFAIAEQACGPTDPKLAELFENYAAILERLERNGEREDVLARVQAIRRTVAQTPAAE